MPSMSRIGPGYVNKLEIEKILLVLALRILNLLINESVNF